MNRLILRLAFFGTTGPSATLEQPSTRWMRSKLKCRSLSSSTSFVGSAMMLSGEWRASRTRRKH